MKTVGVCYNYRYRPVSFFRSEIHSICPRPLLWRQLEFRNPLGTVWLPVQIQTAAQIVVLLCQWQASVASCSRLHLAYPQALLRDRWSDDRIASRFCCPLQNRENTRGLRQLPAVPCSSLPAELPATLLLFQPVKDNKKGPRPDKYLPALRHRTLACITLPVTRSRAAAVWLGTLFPHHLQPPRSAPQSAI